MAVRAAPIIQPLVLPGETRGWYESTIYARVSGYIEKWYKDIGDKVTKDEVLATIETPELDAQLDAAKAKLVAADAGSKSKNPTTFSPKPSTNAGRERRQACELVSIFEIEQKQAERDSGLAKLNAAKAQSNLCQAQVLGLEALSNFKDVKAPYDGVITSRHIDIGDLVTAGSTASTTPLYGITQSNKIRIFVDAPQIVSAQMKVGMPAVVVAKQFPDQQFHGTIARTSNALDPVARTLRVEVDVDNPDLQLVPGMYVEVTFELIHPPMMQVPASALLFRAACEQVAVVDDSGHIHFRDVHIANDQGDFLDIENCACQGLKAPEGQEVKVGQKVALNLSSQIHDGDAVQVEDLDADQPHDSEPTPPAHAAETSATPYESGAPSMTTRTFPTVRVKFVGGLLRPMFNREVSLARGAGPSGPYPGRGWPGSPCNPPALLTRIDSRPRCSCSVLPRSSWPDARSARIIIRRK